MSDDNPVIQSRDELEVLISEDELRARIAALGAEIHAAYGGEDIHVVAVLKGCFPFLADLVRQIPTDRLSVDFLGLSSYGVLTKSSGVVRVTQDLSLPIEGRNVLIVEDIIDTGLTMTYLMENLQTRRPKSIKVCTLLHKPGNATVDFDPDFIGFTIPNEFVIGYGLDYQELYRNVPFIGVVRK